MKSNGKIINFIKRNRLYILIALCVLAVGLSLTFVLLSDTNKVIEVSNETEQQQEEKPNTGNNTLSEISDEEEIQDGEHKMENVVFIMPVNNYTDISAYSDTMVFNNTMNRYSSHQAVDFYAEEGENVLCVYDGVVESVDYSLLTGYTITIDHGNGLKTVYNSLSDGDNVTIGQELKSGDVIGEVSVSNRQEYKDGAHLHFAVLENGKYVSPAKYLIIPEK